MTTIRILCDNNIAGADYQGEHGFAALLTHQAQSYLFDTGQGHALAHNVAQSGVRLEDLKAVLLSHGHYDHTGGLAWVLGRTGAIEVHAHPEVFSPHLALTADAPDKPPRYVGCSRSREDLEAAGACFVFHDNTVEIAPGLWFISGYARRPAQTPYDGKLVLDGADGPVPDPMNDDASLLLETPSGHVLLLGCAHGGVLNILDHIRERLGINRLQAVLGGTHMMFFPPDDVRTVIDALEGFDVALVGVSHCTGREAAIQLAQHFGGRFHRAAAGSAFHF
ncbi:MAG: MBL fold metallo-hydrolase [Desulfobacterales bacterium]|nr:MBL fold metallo-hydrolase [Desulfobacterales bacterium]